MSKRKPASLSLDELANKHLGFDELRPGQQAGLSTLLAGRDTLVVMPTGGGKSAIYQMAALLIPGVTVVVSPLSALQRDQAQAIDTRRRLLDGVATDRVAIAGMHLPFPGLGHVARDGEAYDFVPMPFAPLG